MSQEDKNLLIAALDILIADIEGAATEYPGYEDSVRLARMCKGLVSGGGVSRLEMRQLIVSLSDDPGV